MLGIAACRVGWITEWEKEERTFDRRVCFIRRRAQTIFHLSFEISHLSFVDFSFLSFRGSFLRLQTSDPRINTNEIEKMTNDK
jgi:hypothetical protein